MLSNILTINEDLSNFFGGINEILNYIPQSKLDYISLFKGLIVTTNSWNLELDLSIFNILPNSVITVLNSSNEFLYNRLCSDCIFGTDDLDIDAVFSTSHADYIIILFKSSESSLITDRYLLVWISHKLKNSDISTLVSSSLYKAEQDNIDTVKLRSQNEIFLSISYLNSIEKIYYKYVPGFYTLNKTFQDVLTSGEEFEYDLLASVFYPKDGWYIFYQKSLVTGTLTIIPLDLYNLVGLGFRRLIFNKTGSVFINTSNSYLQLDTSLDASITSNQNADLFTTDRFIRLEGYFIYRKASDCINVNISTGSGSVNVIEPDDNDCGDIITTTIFGEPSLNDINFLDMEIFFNEDSFLNECINNFTINPTQIGFCLNVNISNCTFNTTLDSSSTTINNNITLASSVVVNFLSASTSNINFSVLNTLINTSLTINNNISTGEGNKGTLSSYGVINNVNITEAVSSVPFFTFDVFSRNRNISNAIFSYVKGLYADCINTQTTLGSVQRRTITGSNTINTNTSSGFSFGSVPVGLTLSYNINTATGQSLSGRTLAASCLNRNISITTDISIGYFGVVNTVNRNVGSSTSSVRYLAPLAKAYNENTVNIVV